MVEYRPVAPSLKSVRDRVADDDRNQSDRRQTESATMPTQNTTMLERVTGIEPAWPAWKGGARPDWSSL
jgi:hypothetical protein